MAKATKPVWILCPRCELNYIKKSDQYCDVCKKEMKLIKSTEDDIGDLELCPICKINFVQNDQEICDSCKQELGMNVDEETENKEISDWHKYIADDDEEDEDDEEGNDLTDTIYEQDEMEDTSGLVEDYEFGDDADKDNDNDDDDDDDLDLDMIDDDEEEDDDDDDDDEEEDSGSSDDDDF